MSSTLNANTVTATTITGETVSATTLVSTGGLTLPSSIVTSYTPTVSAGTSLATNGTATGYYMTLGGIKLCWGEIPLKWTGAVTQSGTTQVSLPTSFFSTITNYQNSVAMVGNQQNQYISGDNYNVASSWIRFYLSSPTTLNSSVTVNVCFFLIGT